MSSPVLQLMLWVLVFYCTFILWRKNYWTACFCYVKFVGCRVICARLSCAYDISLTRWCHAYIRGLEL